MLMKEQREVLHTCSSGIFSYWLCLRFGAYRRQKNVGNDQHVYQNIHTSPSSAQSRCLGPQWNYIITAVYTIPVHRVLLTYTSVFVSNPIARDAGGEFATETVQYLTSPGMCQLNMPALFRARALLGKGVLFCRELL